MAFLRSAPLFELRHTVLIQFFVFGALARNILTGGNVALFLGHIVRISLQTDGVRIIIVPGLLRIRTEHYRAVCLVKPSAGDRDIYFVTSIRIVTV